MFIFKESLNLMQQEGIRIIKKSDGKNYTVRDDRSKFFFPEEWLKFYNTLKPKNQPLFDTLINTGARIDEALHIRPKDFDWDRKNLTLVVTKKKAMKKETASKRRTFTISSQYARRMRKYISDNKLGHTDILFPITSQGTWGLMKRKLKSVDLPPHEFSLHNIRKTHGNWLNALEIPANEICQRLGHDMNTFIKHYGSPNIFDRKDKQAMVKILGDVYGFA